MSQLYKMAAFPAAPWITMVTLQARQILTGLQKRVSATTSFPLQRADTKPPPPQPLSVDHNTLRRASRHSLCCGLCALHRIRLCLENTFMVSRQQVESNYKRGK